MEEDHKRLHGPSVRVPWGSRKSGGQSAGLHGLCLGCAPVCPLHGAGGLRWTVGKKAGPGPWSRAAWGVLQSWPVAKALEARGGQWAWCARPPRARVDMATPPCGSEGCGQLLMEAGDISPPLSTVGRMTSNDFMDVSRNVGKLGASVTEPNPLMSTGLPAH